MYDCKALYGTREAGRCWEAEYTKSLVAEGFQKGVCNPCMFYHRTTDVSAMVHGDDFTISGLESELRWIAEVFKSKYKTNVREIIMGLDPHDVEAMTFLNFIVEWQDDCICLDEDPRHVDLILEDLLVSNGNGSDVIGSRSEVSYFVDNPLEPSRCHEVPFYSSTHELPCHRPHRYSVRVKIRLEEDQEVGCVLEEVSPADHQIREPAASNVHGQFRGYDYAECRKTRRSTNGGVILLAKRVKKRIGTPRELSSRFPAERLKIMESPKGSATLLVSRVSPLTWDSI